MSETKVIPLTRGAEAIVSEQDYARAAQHSWHLTSHGYAVSVINHEWTYLHRFINQTPKGYHTDHRDRNKLNNTRENLRTSTCSQNLANQRKRLRASSSQFKGVCFVPGKAKKENRDKWTAYLTVDGQRSHLGHFVSELDAALAYNIAATKAFGDFARVNVLPLDFLRDVKEPRKCVFRASQYRGVGWNKSLKYWTASLTKGGKKQCSYHRSEQEAAIAWNVLATQSGIKADKLNVVILNSEISPKEGA